MHESVDMILTDQAGDNCGHLLENRRFQIKHISYEVVAMSPPCINVALKESHAFVGQSIKPVQPYLEKVTSPVFDIPSNQVFFPEPWHTYW